MSSHHIIREKQEPALLIADLHDFDLENLGQLLEWSPTVVVLKNAVEKIASLGLKIDVIVGDEDAHSFTQEHTKFIKATHNQLLDTAFLFLIEEGYPAVNVIVENFNIDPYPKYVGDIDIVLLNKNQRAFTIKSGFSKWKPAHEQVHLLSKADDLHYEGLKPFSTNSFITEKDGLYKFTFANNFIFIAESL